MTWSETMRWRRFPPDFLRTTVQSPVRKPARVFAGAGLLLCLTRVPLGAQGASPPPAGTGGWVRESWSIADGLPVNSINALLQSRAGYLWAATFDGLVRFDGVRFTVFNSSNTPGLPSDRILSLLETPDSSLWLRTEQGYVVRFARGRFTHIDQSRGFQGVAWSMYEDPSGQVYIGTDRGLGRIEQARFVPVAPGLIQW